MAKTPVNTALGEVRGMVDNWVFRRLEGESVIGRRPRPSSVPPTEDQLKVRERFRRAILYAKSVFRDPERKQSYRELAQRRGAAASRLFGFIVRDYAQPPRVTEIDAASYERRIGDPIRVYADDDGEVTSVNVVLRADDGTILEQGAAEMVDAAWRYLATTEGPAGAPITVEVTALDRAENRTVKTIVLP